MDPRTLIASRIDLHLRRQLGMRLDCHRALTDAAYVRDVLLVCDAMLGTDLPSLAHRFRVEGEPRDQSSRNSSPPSATWSPTA